MAGVILNLAIFFAWHALAARLGDHETDGERIGLVIAALVMMFRSEAGLIPVLLSCAMLGMVWRLTT